MWYLEVRYIRNIKEANFFHDDLVLHIHKRFTNVKLTSVNHVLRLTFLISLNLVIYFNILNGNKGAVINFFGLILFRHVLTSEHVLASESRIGGGRFESSCLSC